MIKFEAEKYKTYKPRDDNAWKKKRTDFISATNVSFALRNFCKDEDYKSVCKLYDFYNETPYQFYVEKTMTDQQYNLWEYFLKEARKTLFDAREYGKQQEENVANNCFELLKEQDNTFIDAKLVANGKTIYYLEGEVISATPDYIIEKANGEKVLLECKTYSESGDEEYKKSKKEDLIEKYKLQVITQMLCSGIEKGYIGVQTHKGDEITGYEIYEIDYPDEIITEIQENILQSSRDCKKWLDDIENNVEKIGPNFENKNDLVLYNIVQNSLPQLLEQYFQNESLIKQLDDLEKQKKINVDLIKATAKYIADNEINIDGYSITSRRQQPLYYDIETIDANIEKLNQIRNKLLNNEKVVSRKGYITIKNIIKTGMGVNDM